MKKRSMIFKFIVMLLTGTGLVILTSTPAGAEAWKPPKAIGLGSTGIQTARYQAAVAISGVLSEVTGTKFTCRPEEKGLGRVQLLRLQRTQFNLEAPGEEYFAIAGKESYDKDGLGPQPLRGLWYNHPVVLGFFVRRDSGIRTWADLKGKRIPDFKAYLGMEIYFTGLLGSFLEGVDVIRIPVGSWGESLKAVAEGALDMAEAAPFSSTPQELAVSRHGIYWIPMLHSDKKNWAKFQKLAPMFFPVVGTEGAGMSKDNPVETLGYCNRWVTYDWQDENLVYWFVKNLDNAIHKAKDLHPYIKHWSRNIGANINNAMSPFHPGAIRFFKEIGIWTPEHEKYQAEKLAQEKEIIAEWKAKHPGWKYSTKGK